MVVWGVDKVKHLPWLPIRRITTYAGGGLTNCYRCAGDRSAERWWKWSDRL